MIKKRFQTRWDLNIEKKFLFKAQHQVNIEQTFIL